MELVFGTLCVIGFFFLLAHMMIELVNNVDILSNIWKCGYFTWPTNWQYNYKCPDSIFSFLFVSI